MQEQMAAHTFELGYERAGRQVEIVYEAERERQSRLQTLLVMDENHDLHAQLAQSDERVDQLETYVQDLQDDVQCTCSNLEAVQMVSRSQSREIETLKAELKSLHAVSSNSNKLLTEKLNLARELSFLKPELDHLRAQAVSHSSLLADKLFLERQLNALELEVEGEKRSTERLASRDDKSRSSETLLEARLIAAQAELAKERRERQRMDREAQKSSTESRDKIIMLESRLDAFRDKLKSTKELLKSTQAELQRIRVIESQNTAAAAPANHTSGSAKKRAVSRIDADTMIGTPGNMPAAKKARVKTLPGEKSTFSVTPFLSRTGSVAPESPPTMDAGNADGVAKPMIDKKSPSERNGTARCEAVAGITSQVQQDKGGRPRAGDAKKSKASRMPPLIKVQARSQLQQVTEEESDGPAALVAIAPPAVPVPVLPHKALKNGQTTTKVMRKLVGGGLGKTLFDEEDGDPWRIEQKRTGGARSLGQPGKGDLKAVQSAFGGFGAISPLKRERKGSAK